MYVDCKFKCKLFLGCQFGQLSIIKQATLFNLYFFLKINVLTVFGLNRQIYSSAA